MSQCFSSTIIKLNQSILFGRFIHPRTLEDGTKYRCDVNSRSDSYLSSNKENRYVSNMENGVRVGLEEVDRGNFTVI